MSNRIVFEIVGKQPSIVRCDNIRHISFFRYPKISEDLKAYDYFKEFGEEVDHLCRELTVIGNRESQYNFAAFFRMFYWTAKFINFAILKIWSLAIH